MIANNPCFLSGLYRSGDYKKVPIAIIDDKQVNGSDEIVSALLNDARVVASLESKWSDMTLDEFKSSPSAEKWTAFAKDDLAALLYPNICRTLGDSFAAFGYVKDVPTFSTFDKLSIRGLGSLAMYLAASKIKCELRACGNSVKMGYEATDSSHSFIIMFVLVCSQARNHG